MKYTILLALLLGTIFTSCYKDAPCRDFRFEVKGEGVVGSVYYSFWGGEDADDDLSGALGPGEVPVSVSQRYCGSDINYLINVYMADSTTSFQLQVFIDDSMRLESTEVIRKYYEGTQYRYALEAIGSISN